MLAFFDQNPQALPVFEKAVKQIRKRFPGAALRVQSTQIAFDDPLGFAFFWLPIQGVNGRPGESCVLSFVLPYPLENPRIKHVTFVRQDRHTHHVHLDSKHGVDSELLGWLEEAHGLMRAMGRGKKA